MLEAYGTAALALAALLQAVRLLRWAGIRTWREPLVVILHIGYGFVPLGFVFAALASPGLLPATAGIHAWTVGAFGTMTLAVMTRATLGHTGHALTASPATRLIYTAVLVAAVTRIWAALQPAWTEALLHMAALAWASAFSRICSRLWNDIMPAAHAESALNVQHVRHGRRDARAHARVLK